MQVKKRGFRPNGRGHVVLSIDNIASPLPSISFSIKNALIKRIRGVAVASKVSP